MARKTNRSACGTSFHNTTVRTSIATLRKLYGDPTCDENYGDDKVNVEWDMELTGRSSHDGMAGNVFTIYDWKEYRVLDENEIVEFHIGGMDRQITSLAAQEMHHDLTHGLTEWNDTAK